MRKFLAIQVDGLSHDRLLDAMHTGRMPFLASLVKEGYKAHQYNCGLPSNTPFAQAGIMYGKNDEIPGFAFIDKRIQKEIKVRNPLNMLFIEHAYLGNRMGILTNGNSYVNIFSGGARHSRFTTSQLFNVESQRFYKQWDTLLLLFNPAISWRILSQGTISSVSTIAQFAYENAAALFSRFKTATDAKYGVTRLFSSVVIEELETGALLRDMKQGVPYLYITYNGYDENSHHQGPTSPRAYDALKDIDRKIESIFRHKKDYDLYILSDHGHTEAVPFQHLYGTTFSKFIRKTLSSYKHETRPHLVARARKKAPFLTIPLQPLALLEKAVHGFLFRHMNSVLRQASWNSHPYFLEVSDDLAHLYFNYTDEKVSINDINARYSGLITALKNHPGIGMVIGSDGAHVHVFSKYGEARIGMKDGEHAFTGERFLKDYGDEKTLMSQIRYLAQMRNAGDLILMGDYSKHNVISFINHYGSHGSCGGEQMHPFFMSPFEHDLKNVTNTKELYDIFIRYHEQEQS